jgi:hypothetical protein
MPQARNKHPYHYYYSRRCRRRQPQQRKRWKGSYPTSYCRLTYKTTHTTLFHHDDEMSRTLLNTLRTTSPCIGECHTLNTSSSTLEIRAACVEAVVTPFCVVFLPFLFCPLHRKRVESRCILIRLSNDLLMHCYSVNRQNRIV